MAEITIDNSSSNTKHTVQDLLSEIDDRDSWVQYFDFPSDSHNLYCAIAECYEQLRQSLPITIRIATDEFMNSIIAFQGYCQDIDLTESDFFTLAISPQSASKLFEIGTNTIFI